jgi:hypothetical protein
VRLHSAHASISKHQPHFNVHLGLEALPRNNQPLPLIHVSIQSWPHCEYIVSQIRPSNGRSFSELQATKVVYTVEPCCLILSWRYLHLESLMQSSRITCLCQLLVISASHKLQMLIPARIPASRQEDQLTPGLPDQCTAYTKSSSAKLRRQSVPVHEAPPVCIWCNTAKSLVFCLNLLTGAFQARRYSSQKHTTHAPLACRQAFGSQ